MNQMNEILDFLAKDKINNINMINFIESYPVHYIEQIGQSVIIKGVSDRNWIYISSKSVDELSLIKNKLSPEDRNFAIIEDWMIPILTEGNVLKWKLSTMKLILPSKTTIAGSRNRTSSLDLEDAEFIYNNSDYKDFLSIEYITARIKNGINSCIRKDDKPIAWAITQDDGAIGFLHVLPEHRKKGHARSIMIDMINKVRNQNKIPFVHIEEENEASMKLITGLGFERYKMVSWFEIE